MTFWSLTHSDFPTDQTFHRFHDLDTKLDIHRIMSGFHGAFATGVACQQRMLTPLDTWLRPLFFFLGGGVLHMLWLLRPVSRIYTDVITLIPNITFTKLRKVSMEHFRRLWHASRESLPSGHLVPSPFWGLACAPIVDTRFLKLVMSLLDLSPWIPIGTFSSLLRCAFRHHYGSWHQAFHSEIHTKSLYLLRLQFTHVQLFFTDFLAVSVFFVCLSNLSFADLFYIPVNIAIKVCLQLWFWPSCTTLKLVWAGRGYVLFQRYFRNVCSGVTDFCSTYVSEISLLCF